jgi:hypothetical protein
VVEGAAGPLGRLAGDGHDLNDLLGGERGRGPGAVVIAEEVVDQGQELLGRSLVLLGLLEGGGGLAPAVAPEPDGQAGKTQLPGHGLDTGAGRQSQQDGGPTDQPLVGRLSSLQAFQQGLLHRGNKNSSGSRSTHSSTHSTNQGAIDLVTMLWNPELTG